MAKVNEVYAGPGTSRLRRLEVDENGVTPVYVLARMTKEGKTTRVDEVEFRGRPLMPSFWRREIDDGGSDIGIGIATTAMLAVEFLTSTYVRSLRHIEPWLMRRDGVGGRSVAATMFRGKFERDAVVAKGAGRGPRRSR